MTVGEGREHRSLIAFGMTEERRLGNDNKKSPFFWTGFFCGDGGSRGYSFRKARERYLKKYVPIRGLIIKKTPRAGYSPGVFR